MVNISGYLIHTITGFNHATLLKKEIKRILEKPFCFFIAAVQVRIYPLAPCNLVPFGLLSRYI